MVFFESAWLISLFFTLGLILAMAISADASGAHINPAVSLGMWLSKRFTSFAFVPYFVAQCAGGVFASLLLFLAVGNGVSLGGVAFTSVSAWTALAVETIATSVFVCVFILSLRLSLAHRILVVASVFFCLHFVASIWITPGLNSARVLGPVVVRADPVTAAQIWVYICGQYLGASIAGLALRLSNHTQLHLDN